MRLTHVVFLALLVACRTEGTVAPAHGPSPGAQSSLEEVHLVRDTHTNDFLNLTVKRSGEARCTNAWPTWPVRGENTGMLGRGDFDQVAVLIDGLGLGDLVGKLRKPRAFEGSITLEWRVAGEQTPTTLECAEEEAPVALEAAALAVEAIGRRVLWRAVEPQSDSTAFAMPAGVPERYAFLYNPFASWGDVEKEDLAAALPYERIELERSECYGTCPAFLLQLSRDGKAAWEGRAYSDPGGHRDGTVSLVEFGRLCWFVEKLDLERLAGNYTASWTDDQTTTIRLVKPDGRVIEFTDYGCRSPIEVMALADMIELVAHWNGWAKHVEKTPAIDAVVLEVNHTLGVVVLNKGLQDGVRVGYHFDVYLGTKYKGFVLVEDAQEATCSARILNEASEIATGDSAATEL